ncbi:MAG: choice-of-anchor T family protein [Thermoplasmata archaeon]
MPLKNLEIERKILFLILFLLVFTSVNLPVSAGRTNSSVTLSLNGNSYTADVSWSKPYIITVSGNVTINNDAHEKLQIKIQAESEFECTINPDSFVRYSSDIVDFVVFITIPENTSEGDYRIKIIACCEDSAGTPILVSKEVFVKVIARRLSVSCEPGCVSINNGESRTIFLNITNRGFSKDSVVCMIDSSSEKMLSRGWEIDLPGLDYGLEPNETKTVTITIKAPDNDSNTNYTLRFLITSCIENSHKQDVIVSCAIVMSTKKTNEKISDEDIFKITYMHLFLFSLTISCIIGLFFITGTEIGYFAFITALIVPLFVRLKKEKVLSNFTRGEIFGYIKANPGVHYMAILHTLDLENGVLAYHLTVLEREGYIKSVRDGLYKRFYPKEMKIPKKVIQLSRLQKDIIEQIRNEPGISQSKIAKRLGESKQVINCNIKILEKGSIIKVERIGKESMCYLTNEKNKVEEGGNIPIEDLALPISMK